MLYHRAILRGCFLGWENLNAQSSGTKAYTHTHTHTHKHNTTQNAQKYFQSDVFPSSFSSSQHNNWEIQVWEINRWLLFFSLNILLGSKDTCRGAPHIANHSNRGEQTEIDQHIPHTCVCDSSKAQCHGCGTHIRGGYCHYYPPFPLGAPRCCYLPHYRPLNMNQYPVV